DNYFRSRLVAQALANDETKDTYEHPRVFITDADSGMDAAIDIHYSNTYPLHCIYHISQNLIRNLKALLSSSFNDFIKDFYLSGISSTSRVESENAVIKNVLQGRPSLCELAAILDLRLSDEARYKYLTEEMLFRQRHEIIQSLDYYTITELPNDSYAEESYDTQQIHLTFLLEDLSPNKIIAKIRGNDVFGPEAVQSAVEAGGESLCHPEQVENPIERRHRGRSSVKRFKSSTEQVKNKKSQNKCGKCGVVGHYAPTYTITLDYGINATEDKKSFEWNLKSIEHSPEIIAIRVLKKD
ncbi:14031_t:CDS:2, partial [Dentiscutata erythropus]